MLSMTWRAVFNPVCAFHTTVHMYHMFYQPIASFCIRFFPPFGFPSGFAYY
jgi:hypothetical protein